MPINTRVVFLIGLVTALLVSSGCASPAAPTPLPPAVITVLVTVEVTRLVPLPTTIPPTVTDLPVTPVRSLQTAVSATQTAPKPPTLRPVAQPTQTATPLPTVKPTLTSARPSPTAPRTQASPTPLAPAPAGCPQGCANPPPNCYIKGNISSSGEKIYHVPGGRYYDATVINPDAGERWFCTEAEAVANGWRKSKQ